jgi:lysozyme
MAWIDTARVIDVAHHQVPKDLDWKTAVANGVVGVIAKATQGLGFEDPAYFEHNVDAYQAHVPLLGAYHFGDGSDGERQARHFLERVHRAYGDDLTGLLLMLDAERNGSQMTVAGAEDFVSALNEAEGRWGWVYMGRDGPTGDRKGLPSKILSNCNLLVAGYGDHPLSWLLPPGFRLPKDGADRPGGGMGLLRGWQFTDGVHHGGAFPGLDRVDQSRLIGVASLDELRALWAS